MASVVFSTSTALAKNSEPVPLFDVAGSESPAAGDTGDSANLIVIVDSSQNVTASDPSQPETDDSDATTAEPGTGDEAALTEEESLDDLVADFNGSLLDDLLAV